MNKRNSWNYRRLSYYKFPSLDDTIIFLEDTVGDSFVCILVGIWLFSPKIPHTSFFFFLRVGGVSNNTEISSGRVTSSGALSVKRYTQKTNTFKKGECIFTSTHQFFKKIHKKLRKLLFQEGWNFPLQENIHDWKM